MSKHFQGFDADPNQKISFFDFWLYIADQLGDARLSINHNAKTIHGLIDTSSDHLPYLKDVITLSYKRSHCHYLRGDIDLIVVLDILGETAFELQGRHSGDLLDIELLEEIAWHISERFGEILELQLSASLENEGANTIVKRTRTKPQQAQVISLVTSRIRRSNKKL